MRKRFYLIILLLLLITTILVATAHNDLKNEKLNEEMNNLKSFIGVNNDVDEPEDKYEIVNMDVKGYNDLKNTIEKHSSSNNNKSYIITLLDGDYNITSPIKFSNSKSNSQFTIKGNGHVIDGNNEHRFMEVRANLKIKDLTIQNTVPENSNTSSAITMESTSQLYLKNCNFINNNGKNKGSSITNRGNCTIINCKFNNNTVDEVGGAIWSTGEYDGSLTIKDTVFENNSANSKMNNERTSIVYMVSYGNNTIENNKFINNTGRCIHAFNQTNTSIVNNKFIDNKMVEKEVIRGGLIDNYEADIHILSNEFINDTTNGELRGGILYHEIGELEFSNNTVNNININPDPTSKSNCSKGGVIFNRNATAKIENNEFNNVLEGNYSRGGVFYNNLGNITIKDNNFTNTVKGNNILGLIGFNDVNSILNVDNNTIETVSNDNMISQTSIDQLFYNSNVPNDEGNGTIGIINKI